MVILLSGFTTKDNSSLVSSVKYNFLNKNYKIGFIPSCTGKNSINYLNKVKKYLSKYGLFRFEVFDIDEKYNENNIKTLFECEIIYFSGGNTFYFLHLLRKRKLLYKIVSFHKNGGHIIGLSAGSLLMTNCIGTAYYGDENYIDLKDLSSFGFVDYEVIPHWQKNKIYLKQLLKYTKKTKNKVITINDGDGIIFNNNINNFFGNFNIIENGKINKL
jgi:dipeptidase E